MITCVAIGKGLGFDKAKALRSIERQQVRLVVVSVEEPLDDDSINTGAKKVMRVLSSEQTGGDIDVVLLASSRGGKIAARILQLNEWMGPTLLLSAMSTAQCCNAEPSKPLLILHGSEDHTNPCHRVRSDVLLSSWAQLVEFPGEDHSLPSLNERETMFKYVRMALALSKRAAPASPPEQRQEATAAARGRVNLLAQLNQQQQRGSK